jgi:cytochrome c2
MKTIFNKKLTFIMIGLLGIVSAVTITGCKASEAVTSKTGAQLWGENCRRCHNAPDPNTFSPEQWKTVGMHMQTRALLTNEERDKIIAFLQQ